MAKKRKNEARNVVVGDIIRRHPAGMRFETDKFYTDLANKIYDIISVMTPTDFTKEEIKEISANITAYCEDKASGAHLFDTFRRLYQRMFNYDLPFFNPTIPCSKEYELNELRFVVWLSIESMNSYRLINPTNRGVKMIADGILELLRSDEMELPANMELVQYLYSEETQNDPIEIKKVLVWLMYDCYLGQWDFHDTHEDIIRMFLDGKGSDRMIQYASRSMCAFTSRTWPLSLKPQTIYAEMIRIDMEDDSDPLAQAIEEMKSAPLGMFHITGCDDQSMTVEDFKRQPYRLSIDSFDYSPQTEIKKYHFTNVIASFISLDNKSWHVNGLCTLVGEKDGNFDTYSEVQRENEEYQERQKHQYDLLVKNNNGNRLFFFKDNIAFSKWLKDDLKLTNVDDFNMSIMPEHHPLAIFIEPNGNMSVNFLAQCIKHPNNKFYNQVEAREYGLSCVINPDASSPEFAQYVIKNNLVPDAMLNDTRGMDHGRAILQDNIEFLARCMRRDIDTDEPFTTRGGTEVENISDRNTRGKMSYNKFIDAILELDDFDSKMHKEWFLIDANEISTVVEDEHEREFIIPTRELYEAHLSLSPDDIINNKVAPFISLKKNIPPATALLFNIMGRQHAWRKLFEALSKGYNLPSD